MQWRLGLRAPSPVFLRRLEHQNELFGELRATSRTNKAARRWLLARVRHSTTDDRRPLDPLLDGRIVRLTAALHAVNTGMTA